MGVVINGTPIGDEVVRILENKTALPLRHITGTIHLIDVNIDVESIKILNLDIIRDYDNNYTDAVTVECIFPSGTFKDLIYPNKENVEFTIETVPVKKSKEDKVEYEDVVQTRYKAKFINSENERIKGSGQAIHSTESLDISEFVTVQLQLIDKANYLMRLIEVGTISRLVTPKDFLETFLTQQLTNFQLSGEEKIIGIDLIEPDNKGQQEQIIIPHGTPLNVVPDYVHNRCCGVYNKGISSYIQNKVWYIYPRHDVDRNPKGKRYITIIVIPPKILPSIEKSWRIDGDHWKILCTGRLQLDNNADNVQLNDGTGVRYTSAVTPLTEGYPARSGNKAILSKEQINTDEKYKLKGKEQIAPYRTGYFTANAFKETSFVSSLNAGLLTCLWENSYPKIIEPGTLAKVLYMDDKGVTLELKGVVLKAHHSTTLPKKGLTQNTWITNTGLFLWVKNDLSENPPAKNVEGAATGWIKGAGAGGGPSGKSSMSLKQLFGGNY